MRADRTKANGREANGAAHSNGNGHEHVNGNGNGRSFGHDGVAVGDGKVEILVPGSHPTNNGPVDVSEGAFADAVLGALPVDLLYRSGRAVGVLAGDRGGLEFFTGDTSHFRLFASEHTRLAKWVRTDTGTKRMIRVTHGRDLATLVVGRAELSERVRRLDRIIHYPAYDRSFELLKPGWTEGTFYDPPDAIADLKPETDREVIAQVLDDLVIDFPFLEEQREGGGADGGQASRENFYGLLLTPIIRTAIEGNVPMHLVNAPLERTGKSKLVEEVLGGIVLGTQMAALQQVGQGDEFDKRVTGLLMQAETLVHLDNVNDAMHLGQLASALTATNYQGRVLGSNAMPKYLNTLIWVVSGNNVEGSGEIIKRVVPIHLQPKDGKPEERPLDDFQHPDLRDYVRSVRRTVLSVLLGMIENWKAAGKPMHSRPMGGFEDWAKVVGGILHVNGFNHWLTNAVTWRRVADRRSGDLELLADAWAARFGDHPVRPRHLLVLAGEIEAFEELRRGSRDGGLNRFGRMLRGCINRPVGEYRIALQLSGKNSHYMLVGAPHKEHVVLEHEDPHAGAGPPSFPFSDRD